MGAALKDSGDDHCRGQIRKTGFPQFLMDQHWRFFMKPLLRISQHHVTKNSNVVILSLKCIRTVGYFFYMFDNYNNFIPHNIMQQLDNFYIYTYLSRKITVMNFGMGCLPQVFFKIFKNINWNYGIFKDPKHISFLQILGKNTTNIYDSALAQEENIHHNVVTLLSLVVGTSLPWKYVITGYITMSRRGRTW